MTRVVTVVRAGSRGCWRGKDTGAALVMGLLILGFSLDTSMATVFYAEQKPTLWFKAESPANPWDNLTLICKSSHMTQVFRLLKDGVAQKPMHLGFPAFEHQVPLGKVTEDITGIYRCQYKKSKSWSPISDLVELTGRENLPPPSLTAHPSPWLAPGLTTTLLCQGPFSGVLFSLRREGDLQVINKWPNTDTEVTFLVALAGSYSYSYKVLSSGHRSEPSRTVIIEKLDHFPAPRMQRWHPDVIHKPGSQVSLLCSADIPDTIFTLMKAGDRVRNLSMSSTSPGKILFKFNVQEGGQYTCRYRLSDVQSVWSRDSSPVEILVSDGSLPKPTLSLVSKDLDLTLGSDVVLRCWGPQAGVTFVLLKEKARRPLQVARSAGRSADFRIPEMAAHVTGNYSCLYLGSRNGTSGSRLSESLELRVEGPLPRPWLWSVWSDAVTPGRDATRQCTSPLPDVRSELLRAGEVLFSSEKELGSQIADFVLSNVGLQDAGNYTCRYYLPGGDSSIRSEESDPTELRVQKESL